VNWIKLRNFGFSQGWRFQLWSSELWCNFGRPQHHCTTSQLWSPWLGLKWQRIVSCVYPWGWSCSYGFSTATTYM